MITYGNLAIDSAFFKKAVEGLNIGKEISRNVFAIKGNYGQQRKDLWNALMKRFHPNPGLYNDVNESEWHLMDPQDNIVSVLWDF